MKEFYAQVRRFLHEAWWELFRWTLVFFIIGAVLSTAVLLWQFQYYPFIVYFVCFWVSLLLAWILMFLRKPMRKEFEGDD